MKAMCKRLEVIRYRQTDNKEEDKGSVKSQRNEMKTEGGVQPSSRSSILVPGRPALHLLSPLATHQKGI